MDHLSHHRLATFFPSPSRYSPPQPLRNIPAMAPSDADTVHTPLLSNTPSPPDNPLSQSPPAEDDVAATLPAGTEVEVPLAVRKRLYVSHFLSTWNSRVFEFGAVLYLASIYPGTLLPMSVYALSRQASAIVLSPVIGRFIDKSNRLKVVRLSIGECPTNW